MRQDIRSLGPFDDRAAGHILFPHPAIRQPLPVRSERLAETFVDQVDCGMLACDATAQLVWANLAARRELESARSLTLVEQAVRCAAGSQNELRRAIRAAIDERRGGLLSIGPGEFPLAIAVEPNPTNDFMVPVAMLLIGRRSVCSPRGVRMLATLHGLTRAESRVLSALVTSSSAPRIAAEHGVSVATVRTQIKALRDKLGVRSIAALLVRAAQVPAM